MKTGIYFCLNGNRVIYIGKTTQWPLRIRYHYLQAMPITSSRFIPCNPDMLNYYEKRWILRFNPMFNSQLKRKLRKKKKVGRPKETIKKFIPMTFRKMTRKSLIGFGSYKGQTVERMLKFKPFDLCKMYFKLSQITFFDDILDELQITSEWRITKPGKVDEKYAEFMLAKFPEEFAKRQFNSERRQFREANNALKAIQINNRRKGYHQAINQGR